MPDRSTKPTAAQAAFGTVAWLILAAVALWWSFDETEPGNRFVLWAVAVMAFGFAIWRAVVAIKTTSASNRGWDQEATSGNGTPVAE